MTEPTVTEEMKKKYLERRQVELVALQNAFANGDYDFLRRIAHQIKGNGSTFGFEQISELGKQIEEGAVVKDAELLRTGLEKLAALLKSLSPNS